MENVPAQQPLVPMPGIELVPSPQLIVAVYDGAPKSWHGILVWNVATRKPNGVGAPAVNVSGFIVKLRPPAVPSMVALALPLSVMVVWTVKPPGVAYT